MKMSSDSVIEVFTVFIFVFGAVAVYQILLLFYGRYFKLISVYQLHKLIIQNINVKRKNCI